MNAYAVEREDGVMLVDCGPAGDPSCERALASALTDAGYQLGDVRLVVGTHTHSDHMGLAGFVRGHTGAEVWMHASTAHVYDAMHEPDRIYAARQRRARAEGVPEELIDQFADVREETDGFSAPVEPDRQLRDGVVIASVIGDWEVLETPGHSPSHICLIQRERGIVILGDLVLPVFAPFFDYGYTPDPVAEYLGSLQRIEQAGDLPVGLSGHGRPLEDLNQLIGVQREALVSRIEATEDAAIAGAGGAWRITAHVFDEYPSGPIGVTHMTEVMAYLLHLRRLGRIRRQTRPDGTFGYGPVVVV